MQIEVAKKLFTVDEYDRMAEAGILGLQDRLELIDGEIIQMSPVGERHACCVRHALHLFMTSLNGRAVVSVQSPVQLNNYTEPDPDLVVLKPTADYYASTVWATDALLIVEVSDTTLRFDRTVKLPKYAAAGIAEVWIENLQTGELLVYRNPSGDRYLVSRTLQHGDTISPLAFPDAVFNVDELLG
jgi:Uma2 family endonuclease